MPKKLTKQNGMKNNELNTPEQQFFDELSDVLEKEFPKFEKCSCDKRLPCRSKALVLFAYANLYFREYTKKYARNKI